MIRLLVISLIAPRSDGRSVMHDDLEEGVEQQNVVVLHTVDVELHGRRSMCECVVDEIRLNHDERIRYVLAHHRVSIERALVGTAVEDLQKLRAPKMKHELRIEREFGREMKVLHAILLVLRELGAESDQRSIEPSHDLRGLLLLGTVGRESSNEGCRGALIEGRGDGKQRRFVVVPLQGDGRHAHAISTRRVLIRRNELHVRPVCLGIGESCGLVISK